MRHPVFYSLVQARVRRQLRRQGVTGDDLDDAMQACRAELIDATVAEQPALVGAIGDGKILNAILDFLRSEQGQALVSALVKILLALIMVV